MLQYASVPTYHITLHCIMSGFIWREEEDQPKDPVVGWFGFPPRRVTRTHQDAVPQSRATMVVVTGPINKLVTKLPVAPVQHPSRRQGCLKPIQERVWACSTP